VRLDPASGVVVGRTVVHAMMMMMVVMRRRKRRRRKQKTQTQSEGENNELLHGYEHGTKPRPLRMARKGVDAAWESA